MRRFRKETESGEKSVRHAFFFNTIGLMNRKKPVFSRTDLCFLVTAAVILVLHILKAPIGTGEADEHFYITLGYRLFQGDAMFFDDWHIAQMISVFLWPLTALYHAFTGSTAGIVLGFRYFYIAFNLLIGIAVYLRFRNHGYGAVCAAAAYMLFAPYNTFALSYNSMGPGFLLLSAMLYPIEREDKLRLYLSGILYAWAVLNTPYLAAVFAVLTVITLVRPSRYSHTRWIVQFLGILTAAVIFLGIVLSRASLPQIFSCLKYLIDPSHSAGIVRQFAVSMGKLVLAFNVFLLPMAAGFILVLQNRRAAEEVRQKWLRVAVVICLLSILYIGVLRPYQAEMGGYMLVLIPVALLGCEILLLYPAEPAVVLCISLSLIDSLAVSLSSNVGPRAFSAPLITACAMTVLLIWESSLKPAWKYSAVGVILGVLLFFNVTFVYLGSGNYTEPVKNGPLAGLKDSPETVRNYEASLSDIEAINAMDGCEYANLITAQSWEYLALTKRMASNSTYAYFWEQDQYTEAMDAYRILHPERYPAYYYLDTAGNRYEMKETDPWLARFTYLEPMKRGALFLAE